MHKYRTHNCFELSKSHVGQVVKLSGWVHRRRDHGNLLFVDLRDHYGITQLVYTNEAAFLDTASRTSNESVVTVTGKVVARGTDGVNSNLPTGEVEVVVDSFTVESPADMLPLQVNDDEKDFPENIRLKYRFLDLRREKIHNNIILRSKVIQRLREQMREALDQLEAALSGEWLVASRITQADISTAVTVSFIRFVLPDEWPAGRYPALERLTAKLESTAEFLGVPIDKE